MKKILKLSSFILMVLVVLSCEEDVASGSSNFISFDEDATSLDLEIGAQGETVVTVYTANRSGSSRTFDLEITESVPGSYQGPTEVTIPANQNSAEIPVLVSDVGFPVNGGSINISIPAGQGVLVGTGGASIDIVVNITCEVPANLDIQFDGYASEITWEIVDSGDNVLYSGGGYADGLPEFIGDYCLAPGNYTYRVFDSFGDGLSFPNNGTITMSYAGNELFEICCNFGSSAEEDFTIAID